MSFPAIPASSVPVAGMTVTATEVLTPVGAFDRATTTWTFGQLQALKSTPSGLLVLAVVLAPCTGLLSLFLLLIKEPNGQYVVPLTITNGRQQFATTVHVGSHERYLELARMATWAQSLLPIDEAPVGAEQLLAAPRPARSTPVEEPSGWYTRPWAWVLIAIGAPALVVAVILAVAGLVARI